MPNTLLTPQVIVNELLRRYKNNLGFGRTIPHEWDDKYARVGGKIGDTLNIPVPVKFVAKSGATLIPQDVEERKVTLKIDTQKHVGFSFTSADRTLTIDRFSDKYLKGAAVALANAVDVDLLTMAYQATPMFVGVPGTTPGALKTFKQAMSWLDKQAAPMDGDRNLVIDSDAETEIIDALKTLAESSPEIARQYKTGRMRTAMGGDWAVDQNIRTHQVGPLGGAPAVTLAGQTGSNILTDGWTAAAALRLRKGDIIAFAGVYAVNPVSGDVLKDLRRFTVTADVNSAANGTATLPVDCDGSGKGIVTTGPYKNCSASPGAGALISVFDKAAADQGALANTLSPQSMVYHRHAFMWASVPLDKPEGVHFAAAQTDPDTKISIRMVSQYAISDDLFITRCDIMYGVAPAIPGWACRVAG